MESNSKGTYVTVVVIVAVVVLGVIMWWLQGNGTPATTQIETSSSTTQVVPTPASDTTANIQADLDLIDTGSTTQDMQKIDADIDSL